MITCTFEDGNATSLRHVVVDTLVIQGTKILLVKRSLKLSQEPGKWALPGGYMNRDESSNDTAIREVLEETGYTIHTLQLLTTN